jgi:ribosomal protein L37AE/L43A
MFMQDYDEWLREKEGTSPYKELEDSVARTVYSMYDFPLSCPKCGSRDLECPNNDHIWRCESCRHTWSH